MRAAPLLLLAIAACSAARVQAGEAFGTWQQNQLRSTAPYPTSFIVRFEPHVRGEVFTMERTDAQQRIMTSSTILYLDGRPRDFQGFGCSGTQSSRRIDSLTVEILQTCAGGQWTRFVRRIPPGSRGLFLHVTEQMPDGRRFERRLVLEKRL
jgi:hypothetical protein